MRLWKKGFEILALTVLVWALFQSFAPAKVERNKVIKKDYDAKAEVQVSHQYGPLTIKKSSDGRIHLEAEMLLEGKDNEDIEAVLERFDLEVQESGNQLSVRTRLNIESCNTINDNMTIKFSDGHKVKGLSQMLVKMTLYVADPERMSLSNKYDRIELADDFNGDLKVNLYSGELLAGSLGGKFQLDLKYGKAKMGSVGRAKWVVYDSEVLAGPIEEAVVSSKYSEYKLGPVRGNLTLETYDEEWKMGSVGGKLTLNDKYSEFRFGDIGSASIQIFDGELQAEIVGNLDIEDTKYTEYKLTQVGNLRLGNVFDDNFEIGEVNRFEARDSKYTEYEIGKLGKFFDIGQSFDDVVRIGHVDAGFSYIHLDGKYTEIEMDIADGANFQFSVNMTYGKVDYPEDRVELRKHEEKDSQWNITGYVGPKSAAGDANSLKIRGFDNTVTWH